MGSIVFLLLDELFGLRIHDLKEKEKGESFSWMGYETLPYADRINEKKE